MHALCKTTQVGPYPWPDKLSLTTMWEPQHFRTVLCRGSKNNVTGHRSTKRKHSVASLQACCSHKGATSRSRRLRNLRVVFGSAPCTLGVKHGYRIQIVLGRSASVRRHGRSAAPSVGRHGRSAIDRLHGTRSARSLKPRASRMRSVCVLCRLHML